MCSNVYDDLICGFIKNTKSKHLENETFFLEIKKNLSLRMRGYNVAKIFF